VGGDSGQASGCQVAAMIRVLVVVGLVVVVAVVFVFVVGAEATMRAELARERPRRLGVV
jgi:hypothetical protein